jgi:hypothetical protein
MPKLTELLPKPDFNAAFKCGRRGEVAADSGVFKVPGNDTWRENPDGTHSCSWCGSMHEFEFFDILEHYVAGDEGYRFSTTDKGYKFYANRPNVTNASEGAIKFYVPHVNLGIEIDRKEALLHEARQAFLKEMNQKYGVGA